MSTARNAPHLLHVFSTFVPAGPELRTVALIEGLGDEFRHSILAVDARTTAAERLSADAPARVLESLPRAGTPKTVRAMRRLFDDVAPDAVLTYNWGAFDAVLAARSQGRPVLHHEDGFGPDEARSFKRRRELARRWVLPGTRGVVVPSRVLRRIALERWGLSPERVVCVPNGVRVEAFDRRGEGARLRAELSIPPAAPVAGLVGHLRPEKSPARFLEACARVDGDLGLVAVVVGDGPERGRLEELARTPALAGRVHLVGHRDDLPRWYDLMDLFCLSSDTEQLPVTLLEAMASRLPAVSTDVGDVGAVLGEEQARWVVPLAGADTASALARALEELAADSPLRERLGAANRSRVEREHDFSVMLDAYRSLYLAAVRA
ncbi:MAG: glycosyltransferase family 4 protein [Planctomycetota bacterium]|jgi:glycosyltransferase involved in cell wall biosynthesis|nr:glycosyltransferase family 4 protein [Planctomycetota bacterium]MDP6764157.1 glycosyltransferase family 4 protein [Planctomycetota bacterium]